MGRVAPLGDGIRRLSSRNSTSFPSHSWLYAKWRTTFLEQTAANVTRSSSRSSIKCEATRQQRKPFDWKETLWYTTTIGHPACSRSVHLTNRASLAGSTVGGRFGAIWTGRSFAAAVGGGSTEPLESVQSSSFLILFGGGRLGVGPDSALRLQVRGLGRAWAVEAQAVVGQGPGGSTGDGVKGQSWAAVVVGLARATALAEGCFRGGGGTARREGAPTLALVGRPGRRSPLRDEAVCLPREGGVSDVGSMRGRLALQALASALCLDSPWRCFLRCRCLVRGERGERAYRTPFRGATSGPRFGDRGERERLALAGTALDRSGPSRERLLLSFGGVCVACHGLNRRKIAITDSREARGTHLRYWTNSCCTHCSGAARTASI
mmetsp:Transcript_38220/g.68232  ORF Transcript_38220/g.68232 Transcript_38220/m.68232 type:complete len:379 (+) Transcript_38220:1030-2166(+)